MSPYRALLVDDEEELRETLREELSSENWSVNEARDGQEALDLLRDRHYDIIVSDIRMPKVDGLQLLTQLRARDRHVTFVLMSAYADIPYWEGYALGADAFFGKPFRIQELEDLLDRVKKPKELRWMDIENTRKTWKISQHVVVEYRPQSHNFSIGRGGMFIDPGTNSVRKGQLLSFQVNLPKFILEGIGKVLWRRGPGEGGLAAGIGVEFLYLEEPGRSLIIDSIEQSEEKSYIPRGALTIVEI